MTKEFVKMNSASDLPDGIYEVRTNKKRSIKAECVGQFWLEHDTCILDDEKITHVKI